MRSQIDKERPVGTVDTSRLGFRSPDLLVFPGGLELEELRCKAGRS